MDTLRIIYKKAANAGMITIESEYVSEDRDYLYLACGRYIKNNIISRQRVISYNPDKNKGLTDDA